MRKRHSARLNFVRLAVWTVVIVAPWTAIGGIIYLLTA